MEIETQQAKMVTAANHRSPTLTRNSSQGEKLRKSKNNNDSPWTHVQRHTVFQVLAGKTRNGQERHIFLDLHG